MRKEDGGPGPACLEDVNIKISKHLEGPTFGFGGGGMEVVVGDAVLRLVKGDITERKADAIVNAANSGLLGGGGVDGAIHRAGGPEIMKQCRRLGGCRTGDAVLTTGGDLKAKYVVHAVGPRWKGGGAGEEELLASAYRRSLQVAEGAGAATVTFPSISTGAYGYPVDLAAAVALKTVKEYLKNSPGVKDVTFVLFSDADLSVYEAALKASAD
jgi:O-acetyl-ADP-ribose deacetylase (regulator of RNase III)